MGKRSKRQNSVATTQVATTQEETMDNGSSSTGTSTTDGITESAKQAAGQAKEAAGRVIDQAKDQAATRVDQQRQSVASGMQAVAQAFQSMGEELKSKEEGPVAQYAAQAGQALGAQVEKLATYLRGSDLHQLVTDAEDFARRSPAVFLGSAFVLGLAASRFLKSSAPSGSGSSSGKALVPYQPPASAPQSSVPQPPPSGGYQAAGVGAAAGSPTGMDTKPAGGM